MNPIHAFLIWLWTLGGVKAIALTTALNFIVAVMAAVHTNKFNPHKLAEFLYRKLLPYVVIYASIKAIEMEAGFAPLALVVFGIIETTLLANLTENLAALSIPLPEIVKRWTVKTEQT